jgi:hypothetical protein
MDALFAAGAPCQRRPFGPSPPAIETLDRVRASPLFAVHANDGRK